MRLFSTPMLTLLLFLNLTTILQAQDTPNTYNITVIIENVKNNSGHVLIGLHTEKTFMKGSGIQHAKCKIENGKVTTTFKNVSPGTYAVLALHDENDNNTMDFEANGMPKEAYGTSNNDMGFGPPLFANAAFTITNQNEILNIRL